MQATGIISASPPPISLVDSYSSANHVREEDVRSNSIQSTTADSVFEDSKPGVSYSLLVIWF